MVGENEDVRMDCGAVGGCTGGGVCDAKVEVLDCDVWEKKMVSGCLETPVYTT